MSTVTRRNPRQVMSLNDTRGTSRRARSSSVGAMTRLSSRTSEIKLDAAESKRNNGNSGVGDNDDDDFESAADNDDSKYDGANRGGRLDTGRVLNPTVADEKETFKLADLLKGIEKLTGEENFDSWYECIMDLQYGRGWPDSYFDQLAPAWNGQTDNSGLRKEIYCTIQMSIGKNLRYLMTGIKRGDVNRLWRVINNKFRHKSTQSVGDLTAEFWQLRMDHLDMPVDIFAAHVRKKGDIIMNMGEKITETQMSTVFLRGLLPEFHTIGTQLRNDDIYDYDQ